MQSSCWGSIERGNEAASASYFSAAMSWTFLFLTDLPDHGYLIGQNVAASAAGAIYALYAVYVIVD